jgi:hypothetical protein
VDGSCSPRISISRALERITLFECGARALLLSQQDLNGPAQVRAFLGALRQIRNIAKSEPPPFIARVLPSGEVRVLTELTCLEARSARGTTNPKLAPVAGATAGASPCLETEVTYRDSGSAFSASGLLL